MRLSENTEKTLIMIVVMTLILSLFFAIISPIGILRYVFGHIFLFTILFLVFGVPIIAWWPDNETDWEQIKNKFRRKK